MTKMIAFYLLIASLAFADTPPPGTVKAKTYSGDGATAITATAGSLNVNVTNSGGLSTVNQGDAGLEAWLVSVTGSALPANACQETGGHLASIDSKLTSPLAVTGTFWQTTQPVSLSSLPALAAGSNTIGKVDINGTVPVSGSFWQATQPVSGTVTANAGSGTFAVSGTVTANAGSGTMLVDGSGVTQPVSGTFWQATQPVSLLSLPSLAAGANTIGAVNINGTVPVSGTVTTTNSANGATASAVPAQATQVGGVDTGGDLRALKVSTAGVLSVDGSAATQPVSGTFWQATQPVSGTFWQATQPVSLATLPALTTGAATIGAVNVNGTVPVSGTFWQATQPVSGTVTANAGSGTFAVSGSVTANIGTTNGLALDASVTGLQVGQNSVTSGQSGGLAQAATTTAAPTYTTGRTNPLSQTTAGALRVDGSATTQPVSGTFWQATQPVSGTVTANAGSGTFAVSGTVTSNIGTTNGLALDASVTGLQVSQGSATSGQKGGLGLGAVTTAAPSYTTAQSSPLSLTTAGALRTDASATTQPVSGTFWQTTQPVSIATAPALVASSAVIGKVGIDQTTPGTTNLVALAANQSVNVAQINGVTTLMGNGVTGTGSQRVTIASNNTAFDVNAIPKTATAVTVKQAAISIGTTAVRLTTDASAPSATRVLLVAQLLSTSTANCYFGSSSVTTTSTTRGVQFFAGQMISFSNDAGDYYGICDSAAQTVYITEQE